MKQEDLEITVVRQDLAGQSVGLPRQEVVVRHIPTGISARCGFEISNHKNAKVAISMVEWGLVEMGVAYE